MRRLFALLAVAVGTAASCGDPGNGEDEEAFVFTPVAVYTVGAEGREGVLYSLNDGCSAYVGDEVQVVVEGDSADEFEDWLDQVGFAVRRSFESSIGRNVLVAVPPGSVPDAVTLIANQPGVRVADPNYLASIPEAPSVGELLGCTPVPPTGKTRW